MNDYETELLKAGKKEKTFSALTEDFLKIKKQDQIIISLMYHAHPEHLMNLDIANFSSAQASGFKRTLSNFLRKYPQVLIEQPKLSKNLNEVLITMMNKSRKYSPTTTLLIKKSLVA